MFYCVDNMNYIIASLFHFYSRRYLKLCLWKVVDNLFQWLCQISCSTNTYATLSLMNGIRLLWWASPIFKNVASPGYSNPVLILQTGPVIGWWRHHHPIRRLVWKLLFLESLTWVSWGFTALLFNTYFWQLITEKLVIYCCSSWPLRLLR